MTVENIVIEIAEEIIKPFGISVVDVEFKKEGKDFFLRVYIDKENGVGIDDCEKVSRALSEVLDEKDPIKEPYYLEVSSPGVDRKLNKEREFLYYIGREVQVKLYRAVNGSKEFRGILKDYKDNTAYIEVGEDIVSVKKSEAVWIRLAFDF